MRVVSDAIRAAKPLRPHFVQRFAGQAAKRPGLGLQALERNLCATVCAAPVAALLQPQQRLADGANLQRGAAWLQWHPRASGKMAVADADAIDRVAHRQCQLTLGVRRQGGVMGGDVRVVQHDVVAQRTAQCQRPALHADAAPDAAVALVDLDQREAVLAIGLGVGLAGLAGFCVVGGVFHAKPSR